MVWAKGRMQDEKGLELRPENPGRVCEGLGGYAKIFVSSQSLPVPDQPRCRWCPGVASSSLSFLFCSMGAITGAYSGPVGVGWGQEEAIAENVLSSSKVGCEGNANHRYL